MNAKERARYAQAEEALRLHFGDGVQCQWEITRPKGTRFAMIAGFACAYRGLPRYVMVQVYRDGAGWEVFAAPHSLKVGDTMQALKSLWDDATQEPMPAPVDPEPNQGRARLSLLDSAVERSNRAARQGDNPDLAAAIRREARALATQWGIDPVAVPGLSQGY